MSLTMTQPMLHNVAIPRVISKMPLQECGAIMVQEITAAEMLILVAQEAPAI